MPNLKNKPNGFPKKHRLDSEIAINELFQRGEFKSRGYLKFRYLPNEEGYVRVVISISKRVGNSPQRNRLKRLIREALRLSGVLDSTPVTFSVFVTKPLQKKPTLTEVQDYIDWFISHLPA